MKKIIQQTMSRINQSKKKAHEEQIERLENLLKRRSEQTRNLARRLDDVNGIIRMALKLDKNEPSEIRYYAHIINKLREDAEAYRKLKSETLWDKVKKWVKYLTTVETPDSIVTRGYTSNPMDDVKGKKNGTDQQ